MEVKNVHEKSQGFFISRSLIFWKLKKNVGVIWYGVFPTNIRETVLVLECYYCW